MTYEEFLEDVEDHFSPEKTNHLSFADEHEATTYFFSEVERFVDEFSTDDLLFTAATEPRVLSFPFFQADLLTGKPERPSNLQEAVRQVLTHLAMQHLENTTLDDFIEETVEEEI